MDTLEEKIVLDELTQTNLIKIVNDKRIFQLVQEARLKKLILDMTKIRWANASGMLSPLMMAYFLKEHNIHTEFRICIPKSLIDKNMQSFLELPRTLDPQKIFAYEIIRPNLLNILFNSPVEVVFFDEYGCLCSLDADKKNEIIKISLPFLSEKIEGVSEYYTHLMMEKDDLGVDIPRHIKDLVGQGVDAVISPKYIDELKHVDLSEESLKDFRNFFKTYFSKLYQNISYHAYVKDPKSYQKDLRTDLAYTLGIVSLRFRKHRWGGKYFEAIFADAGNGIPTTLRPHYSDVDDQSDFFFLKYALEKGTSRFVSSPLPKKQTDDTIGAGLFDVYDIVKKVDGMLSIRSGNNKIQFDRSTSFLPVLVDGPQITNSEEIGNSWFPGTLVKVRIPIKKAFKHETQLMLPLE